MTAAPTQNPNVPSVKKRRVPSPEQEIIQYISQFMPLREAEAGAVVKNMKLKSFKNGSVLLQDVQVSKRCYVVCKCGSMREFLLVGG